VLERLETDGAGMEYIVDSQVGSVGPEFLSRPANFGRWGPLPSQGSRCTRQGIAGCLRGQVVV
jgi:hypothetical protein